MSGTASVCPSQLGEVAPKLVVIPTTAVARLLGDGHSGADELHVPTRGCNQGFEIVKVGGSNVVAVDGEKRHRGVIDIGRPGRDQEFAGGAPELLDAPSAD